MTAPDPLRSASQGMTPEFRRFSRLVAAIVDRVTFNAHILETGTQSYRLRTSKNTSRANS